MKQENFAYQEPDLYVPDFAMMEAEEEYYTNQYEQICTEEEISAILRDKPLEESLDDYYIFVKVYSELLKTDMEDRLYLIANSLKGYLDKEEVGNVYDALADKYKDIAESDTAWNIILITYRNDKYPCNLGMLFNHYKDNEINKSNLYELQDFLNSRLNRKKYYQFLNICSKYPNIMYMLKEELFDYVDNTVNVFIGIIHGIMALLGYGSRILAINGGAEVGKSEYINTIEKLLPDYMDLGSSTPASVRRRNPYTFDRKIVYLGDKGLKGKSAQAIEEFEGLYEVFGGLVTENKFKRDLVVGKEIMYFNLKSDGIIVLFTQPYTNLKHYGAGDQYTTRSTFITINEVENPEEVFLNDVGKENPFYDIHRRYVQHILANPLNIDLSKEVLKEIFAATKKNQHDKGSIRTAKYYRALLKAYCQYLRIDNPTTTDVQEFFNIFETPVEITKIERLVYEKLYNNLQSLNQTELELKLNDSGGVYDINNLLTQRRNRREKCFFTARQIKTYFREDFKMNKNLKDIIDEIPEILHNLYDAGYLSKLDSLHEGQNVYYLPFNEEIERIKESDNE